MAEKPVARMYGVVSGPSSKSGGGNGGDSSLEARVASLEDKFERIDAKLDVISRDVSGLIREVSYLKGRVDAMPSTLQMLAFVLAVLGIAGLAKYFAI